MTHEPTITCPACQHEFKLNETLAAPLIAAAKSDYEKRLADVQSSIREREAALAKNQEALDEQIAERLKTERTKIAEEEARKAKRLLGDDLERKSKELEEVQEVLKRQDEQLAEAQKDQAELKRKQRELDEKMRAADLTIETRITEGIGAVREKATKEAEDKLSLKMAEQAKTIEDMKHQLEEAQRRAEQGSQQLQGEVQELALEDLLRTRFPLDAIEPVPKGEFGGDVLHRVVGPLGQPCGTILWEFKRTKNWSNGWLEKLRGDQRTAKAEIAAIISHALPPEIESFQLLEGVWIVHPRVALPVAIALRQILVEVGLARGAQEGQKTKMEMVYQYLTGPQFRQRVEAIVEAFSTMQADLQKEKKVIMKQWDKREMQLGVVMQSTVGMYGDLQGISGKTLQEIEGLELPALDYKDTGKPGVDLA